MTLTLKQQRAELHKLNTERRQLQGKVDGYSGAKPPTRLTVSEVARTLLNRTPRELSHVTLGRNAKGDTTIEVAFYAGEFEGIEAPGQLRDLAATVYDELRERYPLESALDTQLRASVAELKRKPRKPKVEQ